MKKYLLLFITLILFILSSCDMNAPLRNKMIDYYSDNEVYSELYGRITSMEYSESAKEIVIEIDILTQNHSFPLDPQTGWCEFSIRTTSEGSLNIHIGDEIEFTSAPMYFYNGHRLPILSLKKGDETILEFEEGKERYILWIVETF